MEVRLSIMERSWSAPNSEQREKMGMRCMMILESAFTFAVVGVSKTLQIVLWRDEN
jgi:hypothetical protein